MASPTGLKPILLHGYRLLGGASGGGGSKSQQIEAWFILKHTAAGPKVEEIFENALTDQSDTFFEQSSCVLIGPSLYVLDGRGCTTCSWFHVTDRVRCLDTKNPSKGWKLCKPLPTAITPATVGVAGNFIYLLPRLHMSDEPTEGYVYDTSVQDGCPIKRPPPCPYCDFPDAFSWNPPFCAAFDYGHGDRGVIAPISEGDHIYVYNPDEKSWKSCCDAQLANYFSWVLPEHAVFNGILYVCFCEWDDIILFVYDIRNEEHQRKIRLPMLENLDPKVDSKRFLVAIADYKLCYLWYRNKMPYKCNKKTLYVATIEVSVDLKSATAKVEEVDVDACNLVNCLHYDSDTYQNKEGKEKYNEMGTQQNSRLYQDEKEKAQGVWKSNDRGIQRAELEQMVEQKEYLQRCDHNQMDEKLRLLEEKLSCLQNEVQALADFSKNKDTSKRWRPWLLVAVFTLVLTVEIFVSKLYSDAKLIK